VRRTSSPKFDIPRRIAAEAAVAGSTPLRPMGPGKARLLVDVIFNVTERQHWLLLRKGFSTTPTQVESLTGAEALIELFYAAASGHPR
jgi:hypothetical protein